MKTKIMPTRRIMIYTFDSYYSSIKNIFLSFIFPTIAFIVLYIFLKSMFNESFMANNTTCWGLMTITPVFSMISIAALIINWRSSNLISKLKIIKIKKYQILLSIWVVYIINTYSCFIINICLGLIVDNFFVNKNFTSAINVIKYFYQWIGILFVLILSATLLTLITFIFSFLFKSPIIIQTTAIILMVWFIFTSDIGLNRNYLNSSTVRGVTGNVLSYFNPLSGFNWFIDGICGNILLDKTNIVLVIQNLYAYIPFDHRRNFSDNYTMIFGFLYSTCWLILFGFIGTKFIKLSKI